MSGVQSKKVGLSKKENVSHVERMQLLETEEEIAQIIDLKYNDMSVIISNILKIVTENLDLVVDETRESLKNDLKAILGLTSSISEMKNKKIFSTRKEYQQYLDSQNPILRDRKDAKGKMMDEINRLVREENSTKQGRELFQNKSQYHKLKSSVEGLSSVRENHGDWDHMEDFAESKAADQVQEMRQERHVHSYRNEEKILADEGILSLEADFSSATLDVNRQWSGVFSILRENGFEPEFQCQVKLALTCDGETKIFSDLNSFSKFINQHSSMKELFKDVLPQSEKIKRGRRYGIQEKMDKILTDSKYGAEETTSDGLSFLFIKEVRVAESEDAMYLETPEESSGLEEEEEVLGLEEEEESLELEDEEIISGTDEEATSSLFHEEQNSRSPGQTVRDRKHGTSIGLEETAMHRSPGVGVQCPTSVLPSLKSLEINSDKHLRASSEIRKTEGRQKTHQTGEQTCKETDLILGTEEIFRKSVVNIFREIQKEIGNIKNHHSEAIEEKDPVDGPNSRINVFEERMNNLEDRIEGISMDPVQMAKQIMKKERLRDREDKSRSSNIRLIGIPEKDNRENGAEDIMEEIIEENFPDLRKHADLEIASACRIPSTFDENRLTPRHILVKFWNPKDKEKILKFSRAREGIITYRGIRIRLTADLSLDTLDARSKWSSIIKVLQEKGFRPKILYPAKLAFIFEGRRRVFYDIEEFRDFIFYIPYLKKLLADVF